MKWNRKKIINQSNADFEGAWSETSKYISKGKIPRIPGKGRTNIVFDTVQKLRNAYLKLGFEEMVNPLYIQDKEIARQFGPEGHAVLDRCYYIGGLSRPDIGLSKDKITLLKELGIDVKDKIKLQSLLHNYKKGNFDADDLLSKIASSLNINDSLASKLLNQVFPEFKSLKPHSSDITLRSHMTSGWFITLEKLSNLKPFPLRLFSVDRCFRREQDEDRTHLRSYHSASCILMDEDVSLEDGKEISQALLKEFGFKDFKFTKDEKRSKYYVPDTQTEVYGRGCRKEWVELATFGIYSPIALSKYKIEYPVMNFGLGVERLSMVIHGFDDIRKLVYPQFYSQFKMKDEELATLLRIKNRPTTKEGIDIAVALTKVALAEGNEKSPCEFRAYNGKLFESNIVVNLVENEENTNLIGPAALNNIYIHQGNVYGVSPNQTMSYGVDTGIRYLDGIAYDSASRIETSIKNGKKKIVIKFKAAKSLGDINLMFDKAAQRYITTKSRKIDIRGPIFITIEAYVK